MFLKRGLGREILTGKALLSSKLSNIPVDIEFSRVIFFFFFPLDFTCPGDKRFLQCYVSLFATYYMHTCESDLQSYRILFWNNSGMYNGRGESGTKKSPRAVPFVGKAFCKNYFSLFHFFSSSYRCHADTHACNLGNKKLIWVVFVIVGKKPEMDWGNKNV